MTSDDALAILDLILVNSSLNDTQEMVFRLIWEGLTYEQIANLMDYDVGYIKHVGSKVLKLLSNALNQKVTKNNCHSVMRKLLQSSYKLEYYPNPFLFCQIPKLKELSGNKRT